MNKLLKLKFTPEWDKFNVCECYRVYVEYIDKRLSSYCISVEDKEDKNNYYRLIVTDYAIELTSYCDCLSDENLDCEKKLIKSPDFMYSYLYEDDLEEVLNALEMLKPAMEKQIEIMNDLKLEEEERKKLWLEKESFEVAL